MHSLNVFLFLLWCLIFSVEETVAAFCLEIFFLLLNYWVLLKRLLLSWLPCLPCPLLLAALSLLSGGLFKLYALVFRLILLWFNTGTPLRFGCSFNWMVPYYEYFWPLLACLEWSRLRLNCYPLFERDCPDCPSMTFMASLAGLITLLAAALP